MLDFANLMAQAQRALSELEERKARIDEELDSITVVGSADGGRVEIALSGNRDVRRVSVRPDAIDPAKPQILEDLIFVALADALRQANAAYESKMAEVSEGLNVGGMDISSVKNLLR